ncbi:hypothetical protein ACVWWO_005729 [Bradyrhizobium sp. F1.13.1]
MIEPQRFAVATKPHAAIAAIRERDQHVVAGQRETEEAPLHLVAANHLHGVEPRQQVGGAAEIDDGTGAVGRSLPKAPFDAGMIGAEPGIGEARQHKDRKARDQQRPRRTAPRRECDEQAEGDREVIGVALLQAERTGHDPEHQLEEPGARDRGGRNQGHSERGSQSRAGGRRFECRYCGTLGRHGSLFSMGRFPRL